MNPRRFALAELPATPWKNGGGRTREIACWPPAAGLDDFDWRVSVATIAASGPFSTFAGIDRVITLLSGDGVLLHGPAGAHQLNQPLVPYAFAGEERIEASLLGDASDDFNVMTRRARCRARVQVLRDAAPGDAATEDAALLLAVHGDWVCAGADTALMPVPARSGVWWAPGERKPVVELRPQRMDAEAAALWVVIEYVET